MREGYDEQYMQIKLPNKFIILVKDSMNKLIFDIIANVTKEKLICYASLIK